MDKVKQYVLLTVLGALVILAAGYVLLVSPKKSQASDLKAQADTQVATNATLATQLTVLKAQAKDLPKQQAALARVAAKIPDNPSLPALVRAVTAAGAASGVVVESITPGTPAVPTAPAATVVTAPPAGGTAAAPAAASAAAPAGAAAGTLTEIPVALSVTGDYFEIEQFLAELENLPRALRVGGLTLAPGAGPSRGSTSAAAPTDGRVLTGTISGTVFMAANRPVQTAVVAPGAPAATGSATTPTAAPAN